MVLGVVQVPSGAVSRHARLAGTLVGAHLQGGQRQGSGCPPKASRPHPELEGPPGWEGPGAHLEPNDTLARLHGGVIEIPLLLLRVLDSDVHAALQPLCLGLEGRGPGCISERQPRPLSPPPATQPLRCLGSTGPDGSQPSSCSGEELGGAVLTTMPPTFQHFLFPSPPVIRPDHSHHLSPGCLPPASTLHGAATGGGGGGGWPQNTIPNKVP